MGRSQETRNKKDIRDKKEKKRKDKVKKKLERKDSGVDGNSLDDMIAYVDENGMITSTPPDPTKKKKIELEDIAISVPKSEDIEDKDPIRKGIVTFFNESKDYGFIRDVATQDSIFVHRNGLTEPITENNKVIFEVEMGHKGPIAVNVKIDRSINTPAPPAS